MALNPTTPCAACGGADDPLQPQIVVVPKGWLHHKCYEQIPQDSIWAFADTIPCCSSNVFLMGLGGAVVRVNPKVPKDELWFFHDEKGIQARFRLLPGGQIEQIRAPEVLNVGKPIDSPS